MQMVRLSDLINSQDEYEIAKTKCDLTITCHFAVIEFNRFIDKVVERRDRSSKK